MLLLLLSLAALGHSLKKRAGDVAAAIYVCFLDHNPVVIKDDICMLGL